MTMYLQICMSVCMLSLLPPAPPSTLRFLPAEGFRRLHSSCVLVFLAFSTPSLSVIFEIRFPIFTHRRVRRDSFKWLAASANYSRPRLALLFPLPSFVSPSP